MAATKPKPSDATGRQREAAIKAANEKRVQDASDTLTAQAEAELGLDEVIVAAPVMPEVIVDDVVLVDDEPNTVVIRVVEDIEAMTFGAGNTYNFKAGQKYEVSMELAYHLQEKGYLANTL